MKYARIIAAVAGTPWAIHPIKGRAIVDFLAFAAAGGRRTPDEVDAIVGRSPVRADDDEVIYRSKDRMQAAQPQASADGGGVAVIGLKGIISPRLADEMDLSSGGGTSAEGFVKRLDAAIADPRIGGVVIDVDSPGGNVLGIKEATDALYRARTGDKPVVAVASPTAASAAYWIAASAGELAVTPSGQVGSIGVITYHEDLSQALETAGVKLSQIRAAISPNKHEAWKGAALSEAALAELQDGVDRYGRSFVDAVARGRGVSADQVVETFGGGRMVGADEALKRGMVDRIATLDEEIRRMSAALARPSGAAKRSSVSAARRRAALW